MDSMIADNINSKLFVGHSTNSALSGDGNLNFDTRLQADAGLNCKFNTFLKERREKRNTDNLLDNFTGGMQVDQTFMNLELVTIPCLGTFTTRLKKKKKHEQAYHQSQNPGDILSYGL